MINCSRYYQILGITSDASMSQIKQAYRHKVKTWHPDLFPHDPERRREAEEKIKEINDAHRALTVRDGKPLRCGIHPAAQWKTDTRSRNSHPGPNGGAATSQNPYVLMRCNHCGHLNTVRKGKGLHTILCGFCGNSLFSARKSGTRPGFRRVNLFGHTLDLPSRDYMKFLVFCFFTIVSIIVTGIGTAILLLAGRDFLLPYFYGFV